MARDGIFQRDGIEYGRGLSFFDAIYGFAITLLIANIDLPPASSWSSLGTLLDDGLSEQLVGFVISFIVIAVFWKHNTDLLGRFQGMDVTIITINLAMAGLVVFLPFTTQAISDEAVLEYPLATAMYALNIALLIFAQLSLVEVGRARGLFLDGTQPGLRWAIRIDLGAQACVFLLSIAVAYLVSPETARLMWVVVLPIVAIVTGRQRTRMTTRTLPA